MHGLEALAESYYSIGLKYYIICTDITFKKLSTKGSSSLSYYNSAANETSQNVSVSPPTPNSGPVDYDFILLVTIYNSYRLKPQANLLYKQNE